MSAALYRIKAVAQRTSVSTATLRAWERRYGMPVPSRGNARYRLYCEADVAAIVAMRDLVRSGIAPADAAPIVLRRGDPPVVAAAVSGERARAIERINAAAPFLSDAQLETLATVAESFAPGASRPLPEPARARGAA